MTNTQRIKQAISKGQATVEFALVLLVLLAVVYGILEVSRLLLINAEIQNAAREGVHFASLHPRVTDTCLQQQVIAPKMSLVNGSALTVTKTQNGAQVSQFAPYAPIEITVQYSWTSLINIRPDLDTFSLKPLGPLTLQATSSALIENEGQVTDDSSCPAASP